MEILNELGNFSLKEAFTAGMVMFAVIDIVGSVPIIVDLRTRLGHVQSEKASAVAGVIMILFLFVGQSILSLIGVDIYSFAIAGAFVLFFLALEMILGVRIYRDEEPKTASIVPLAFPLIAGPGVMTTILSLRSEYDMINIIIAIVANVIVVYLVLKLSAKLEKLLGSGGLSVLRKVFGIVLLAISVKLFFTNISKLSDVVVADKDKTTQSVEQKK